jgi:hypothetical protein
VKQHIERWKKKIAESTRVAELLETGEMRTYSGPRSDPQSDVSAREAARLRDLVAELQGIIDRVDSKES